jgi:hypothetical protein
MNKLKAKEMYIIVWDEDGDDPVYKCNSFTAAEKKVKQLIDDGVSEISKIQVYKVLEAYKLKLELIKV